MDLKFDRMAVNTTLAQDYLKNENLSEKFSKMSCFDGKEFSKPKAYGINDRTDVPLQLKNLAERLKENVDLFAQLDYLERNVPIKDTHDQIHLIIQQLYYVSSRSTEPVLNPANYVIKMLNDTPLQRLGLVGKRVMDFVVAPVIWSSKETLAICHLFTKLCYESGITGIQTCYDGEVMVYDDFKEERGAVGVISEYSDVDSAVDVFLTSSKQVPWSLRRILVQESVYTQFNNALSWKCKSSMHSEEKSIGISIPMEHNGRKFLIDSVGNLDPKPTEVAVESYRTIKELISLLNQYQPHYLSLWANNTAEINEITLSISSEVVWVNSFADFRGPPRITEAIFSYLPFFYPSSESMVNNEIRDLQQSWLKLDIQDRYNILVGVLIEVAADQCLLSYYLNKTDNLRKIDIYSFSFVNAGKDYVCIGVPAPSDRTYSCCQPTNFFVTDAFYEAILIGNAFVFKTIDSAVLINALKKAGVPVVAEPHHLSHSSGDYSVSKTYTIGDWFHRYQCTRVIWTNSGTIFAN